MVDLSHDRAQWQALEDRSLVSFVLGSLMVAEERITTKFSGLLGAVGSEEEVAFLATQQVDEARHMQFYARFQDEVVAEPATIAAHVQRARAQISPAFHEETTFEGLLQGSWPALLAGRRSSAWRSIRSEAREPQQRPRTERSPYHLAVNPWRSSRERNAQAVLDLLPARGPP